MTGKLERTGVQIGGVTNLDLLRERVQITRLKPLSPDEAKAHGYQKARTPLIPELPFTSLTDDELKAIAAPDITKGNIIFLNPIEPEELERLRQLSKDRIAQGNSYARNVSERIIIDGIPAMFKAVVQADSATTSRVIDATLPKHKAQDLKEGELVGVHFDGGDYPETSFKNYRILVHLGELEKEECPKEGERYSLFVPTLNVDDIKRELVREHKSSQESFNNAEIHEYVADLAAKGQIQVARVRLEVGQVVGLPAPRVWHDGSIEGENRPHTLIAAEPKEQWGDELFDRFKARSRFAA